MARQPFSAAKTRSSRPGWSVTFRHPLKLDSRRKPGRKIRRGLGTADDVRADEMVAEMNRLLADSGWWNPIRRREAARLFAPEIVAAFYDDLSASASASVDIRERAIPMPWHDEGYSRVLFVGTTGAGKTTLLRQLIGSDPDADRFPSTAPAKTTIADIEVVLADAPYEAVVTFFPEVQIQALVEECVLDAAMAARGGASTERVADRFLNHRDQRFRLSYVLGPYRAQDETDDFSFDDDGFGAPEFDPVAESDELPDQEREANAAELEIIVERVIVLSRKIAADVEAMVRMGSESFGPEDRESLEQLTEEAFEAVLHEEDEFGNLVQDVLDAVILRFRMVDFGELSGPAGGWPESWSFATDDRSEFIRTIRWFSSNFWPHFGRLLTPVVDGIRVSGPLYSDVRPGGTKLVLIDGQGMGHTPDYGASVSTNITGRFDAVDVILLVDNAQQPMQNAPLSLLRVVAATGHAEKLVIAFTHFDLIRGPSLATNLDRRSHVMGSVLSALAKLREFVGSEAVRGIEHRLDERCFMLGGTDRQLRSLPAKAAGYMHRQLDLLVGRFEDAAAPSEDPVRGDVHYDPTGLLFAVQDAVTKFQRPWSARLGLSSFPNVRREHWTRVKALTKRIGTGMDVEYDTLQPLADVHRQMQEAISLFLGSPAATALDDDDLLRTLSRVRRLVASRLLSMLRERLVDRHLVEWIDAYQKEIGAGSSTRRAERIARIYAAAVPVPQVAMSPDTRRFVDEIVEVVRGSVESVGGSMSPLRDPGI